MASQEHVNLKDEIQVEILCTKLIKPSSPTTPAHLQSYKLSFFDQIADKEHIPLVLFYPCDSDNAIFTDKEIDERLEQSLSKILTHVYPAAGRYAKDERSVLCHGQGVPYTKANVNCHLNKFLEEAKSFPDLSSLFWPNESKNVSKSKLMATPIVTAQVTKFECGGVAISLSTSHPVIDGYTCMTFAFEWANVCRLGTPTEKINFLSFDSSIYFPTRDLSTYFKNPSAIEGCRESNIVVRKFVVDEAAILRLRKEVGGLIIKPSKVEMITALLWRALIRVSHVRNGYLRPSLMCFPVNLRSKFSLPKMGNSMGNLVIYVPVKFIPGETPMEIYNFVVLIRDAVQKTFSSCAEAKSPDEIVSNVAKIYNGSYEAPEWGGNDEVDKVTCSSLCRFPMQDADFGLGKPSLMFFGLKDTPMFWLHDTLCRTGVGLQIDLKENYMQLFQCDHDIKAFTTTYY